MSIRGRDPPPALDRRCELLRFAYVNAGYSPEYKLTDEEMGWIGERVAAPQELVRTVCEKRLAPRD